MTPLLPDPQDPTLGPVFRAAAELPDEPTAAQLDRLAAGAAPVSREVVRQVVTQVLLRRSGSEKLGGLAERMLLTRAGLEQASRPVVAARRARRLAELGAPLLVDLGCGLGIDAMAACRAGVPVLAVERDHVTAAAARENLAMVAREPGAGTAEVVTGAAGDVELPPLAAAFVDPGRRAGHRTGGAARRVTDPDRWDPPWSWVLELAARHPATVAKVAPGVPHDALPPDTAVEWVSVGGRLVEAGVWFPGLSEGLPGRSAVILSQGPDPWTADNEHVLSGRSHQADAGPPEGWLLEPDPAVIRSHLVAELCAAVGGHLLSPGIAYVTTGSPPNTPFAQVWPILDVLPARAPALRAALAGYGSVEIRTRGLGIDPQRLRRDLRLTGSGGTAHVALTRLQGKPAALLLGGA